MNTYLIHESNIERLEKKMNTIKNKCKKFGCDFHFEEVGEEFKDIKDENGNVTITRYVIVEAEGIAIINNWKYIASIEHTKEGNIIHKVTDVEIPEKYFTTAPICEHCHSKRQRKETCLIMNTITGEFKQVGKSCLHDFTCGMSAEAVASYTAMFDELIKGEAPCGGGYGKSYFPVKELLAYTVETIKHYGYIKSNPWEVCTKEQVDDFYNADKYPYRLPSKVLEKTVETMKEIGFNPMSEENMATVEKALEWIKAQERTNDYMSNLITICNLKYVAVENFGFLVSLIPTWNKTIEAEAKRKEAELAHKAEQQRAEWVGAIKDKVEFKIASFTTLTSWETQWGLTSMYKFTDEFGNIYIWKTDKFFNSKELEDMEKCTLKGTIKEHSEFRDVKQNILTRCKITQGC